MPNWCNNSITIKHKDPAMIERVIKAEGLLMEFLPTPKELVDTVAGFKGEDEREAHEAQQKANIEKFGYKDWYDWNVANWGTKWDVNLEDKVRVGDTVTAWFESAWAPPCNAYEKLCALGFEIKAYYNEPGMAFCGIWEGTEDDFYDDYYEYGSETSATVREVIGAELDDFWNISEDMANYEEENANE